MVKDLEAYIAELEEISEKLNSEDIKLDGAMKLYKKGMESAKSAKKLLSQYENELEIINEESKQ